LAAAPQLARSEAAEATRDLYERYSEPIFRFCLAQLESREEAEDALQSTFLNAFRGLKRGTRPASESAWLYKIAHNICLTRRRSTLRRGRVETANDLDVFEAIVPAPAPAGVEELIALGEALESMPKSQRRAILLREWRGLSYREIGEQMGLSQAAVETLIFRARRSLAERLEHPARARIRHALDAGWLAAALKGLLGAGAATKAVATATVAATAVVLTVGPLTEAPESPKRAAVVPQAAAPAPARSRATPVVDEAVRSAATAARVHPRRAQPPARAKRPTAAAAKRKQGAPPSRAATAPEPAKLRPPVHAAKPKPEPARAEKTKPAKQKQQERRFGPLARAGVAKEMPKGPPGDTSRGRSDEAKEPGSNKPTDRPAVPQPAPPEVAPAAPAAADPPANSSAVEQVGKAEDKEKKKGTSATG
jgi:RNA polymerase sigma-70 factor (ECF subfamily)